MYDGEITIKTRLETKEFDSQIASVEEEIKDLQMELKNADKNKLTSREIIEYNKKLEVANNKLKTLVMQKEKANATPMSGDVEKTDIGMGKILKKVAKWSLAVFSVRSAYNFVRSSISTISQYDKQLGANIEYIRYALAMTIKPIVEWLVNSVYKLLQYINYIANAWFGVNLFSNASAKNFNQANTNAKKLQKTMASFDEMNTLSSNNDTSGSVGNNFDLSKMGKVEIPSWVQWIADNKDTLLGVGKALALLFAVSKVRQILSNIGLLMGAKSGAGLLGLLQVLGALAIADAISIVVTGHGIGDVIKALKDLNEQKELLNKQSKHDVEVIDDLTKKYYEHKNSLNRDTRETKLLNDAILENVKCAKLQMESGLLNKEAMDNEAQTIRTSIALYNDMYKSNLLNTSQQYDYIKALDQSIDVLEDNGYATEDLRKQLELIRNQTYRATIKAEVDANGVEGAINKFKNLIKSITPSFAWGVVSNMFDNVVNKVRKTFGYAKGGIVPTYYASGGIINNPGQGVPINGNSVGGERGMEGIIPMTNAEQMAMLGEAIGRYVNINLTSNTNLDGRLIARQISKVQSNMNFASNR